MPIDDIPHLNKISRYNHNTLPSDIYVAYENAFIILTEPSKYQKDIILTSYAKNKDRNITRYTHGCGRVKRGYCDKRHGGIIYNKKRFYLSVCYINMMVYNFYIPARKKSDIRTCLIENQHFLALC